MNKDERISFLAGLDLFSEFTTSELADLAEVCFPENYKKKSYIFFERDQGFKLFLIEKGKVKITKNDSEGNEIILAIMCEEEAFGEMSLIDGFIRNANAIAMEDVSLLSISDSDFGRLLHNNSKFCINLLKIMTLRLRIADYAIKGLFLDDVQKRVIICLYNLAGQMGKREGKSVIIESQINQSDFASLAGTTRETLSRTLRKLEIDGIILRDEKKLVIPNYVQFMEKYIFHEM